MERINIRQAILPWLQRYRYVLLVFAAGLCLMMFPTKETTQDDQIPEQIQAAEPVTPLLQDQLAHILGQISGVGKVSVLLTQSRGEQLLYQTDDHLSGDSRNMDTVILTDASRDQQGLVTQVLAPTYQGAVVVCQGGDSPAVRLAVVEAVSKATGLSSEKIVVLKMK